MSNKTNKQCVVCESPVAKEEALSCKHRVCKKCLSKFNNEQCPICRRELEGPLITPEIKRKIHENKKGVEAEKVYRYDLLSYIANRESMDKFYDANISELEKEVDRLGGRGTAAQIKLEENAPSEEESESLSEDSYTENGHDSSEEERESKEDFHEEEKEENPESSDFYKLLDEYYSSIKNVTERVKEDLNRTLNKTKRKFEKMIKENGLQDGEEVYEFLDKYKSSVKNSIESIEDENKKELSHLKEKLEKEEFPKVPVISTSMIPLDKRFHIPKLPKLNIITDKSPKNKRDS
jgi:flagellar biosynthesis GTPase FlhF